MQIPTHIMSGWCVANLFPSLNAKQRLMCMIATAIPDLDGLSILGGQQSYWHWHHRICHNLPFGILVCLALTAISGWRIGLFVLYLALFHLHLNMDVFGSGPGWGIFYFWPFSDWMFDNSHLSWDFYSWENLTIAAGLLVWTIAIAIHLRRTPLEYLMPDLDRQLVEVLRKPFKKLATDENQMQADEKRAQ
jgi:inner membrane protein